MRCCGHGFPQPGEAVRRHHIQQHAICPATRHAHGSGAEGSHRQRTGHGIEAQAVTPAAGRFTAEVHFLAIQQAAHYLRGFIQLPGSAGPGTTVPLFNHYRAGCPKGETGLAAGQVRNRGDTHRHGHRGAHRYRQWADTEGDTTGPVAHGGSEGKSIVSGHFPYPQLRVTQPFRVDGDLEVLAGGTVLPQGCHYTEFHLIRL